METLPIELIDYIFDFTNNYIDILLTCRQWRDILVSNKQYKKLRKKYLKCEKLVTKDKNILISYFNSLTNKIETVLREYIYMHYCDPVRISLDGHAITIEIDVTCSMGNIAEVSISINTDKYTKIHVNNNFISAFYADKEDMDTLSSIYGIDCQDLAIDDQNSYCVIAHKIICIFYNKNLLSAFIG